MDRNVNISSQLVSHVGDLPPVAVEITQQKGLPVDDVLDCVDRRDGELVAAIL